MAPPIKPPPKLAISSTGQGFPSKAIFYGVPGIGKTSVAAYSPRPIFVMTQGENGLETLIDNGIVPQTDHFPEVRDWLTLLQALDYLLVSETPHKTLVVDTLNGCERLCFDYITRNKFDDDPASFQAYGRGPEVSVKEWSKFVNLLHKVNTERRMAVLCLAHCRIKTFKNPEGEDFDRYNAELHDKTWAVVEKWADLILFGNYETHAKKEKGALKAKGFGKGVRLFYTQRSAAYDAKNRFNLPAEIPMGPNPQEAWRNLAKEIRTARETARAGQAEANGKKSDPSPQPEQQPVQNQENAS